MEGHLHSGDSRVALSGWAGVCAQPFTHRSQRQPGSISCHGRAGGPFLGCSLTPGGPDSTSPPCLLGPAWRDDQAPAVVEAEMPL